MSDRAESVASIGPLDVVVAGPAAIHAFHHILGIPPALRDTGACRITSVVWKRGALQIDLEGRDFRRAVLRLEQHSDAPGTGPPLIVSTDVPPESLHPAVNRILGSVRARLARTPMAGLLDLIRRDPASTLQTPPSESDGAPAVREGVNRVPKPYAHEWTGKPDELGPWGLFFDDLVFVYTAFTRVNFVLPTTLVMHGTHECLCVTPKLRTRSAWIFNHPRRATSPTAEKVRRRLGLGPQHLDKPFRRLSTDMTELDTVLGAEDKLARALRSALAGNGERLVGLHTTCLPKVMGEDVERPLELVRNAPQVHCLSSCMGFTHDTSLYAEELEFGDEESGVIAAMLLPPGSRGEADRDTPQRKRFDLVGFPDGADTLELASLLEQSGADLDMLLLPDIDLPVFRRTPRPPVQVRFPNRYYDRMYEQVFDRLADRVACPPAPFGLAASDAWVRTAASALDLDAAAVEETLQRAREAIRPRWEPLAAMARNLRLGFVVDPRVLPRLVDPSRSFGLSMPDMLSEMGFGIDLLCYAPEGDASYAESALRSDRIALRPFRNPGELRSLLRDVRLGAVYSDRCFERRLTSAGKAQFGFGDFELGFQGALRSLERLVRACTLPFYARYARFLGRGAS